MPASKAYLGLYETTMMKLFGKIANGCKPFTILAKNSTIDVCFHIFCECYLKMIKLPTCTNYLNSNVSNVFILYIAHFHNAYIKSENIHVILMS